MLRVVEPGLLSTVQDGGRPSAVHLGVPVSGACDAWSMAVANRLLDNAPGAAVLEMTLQGATFEVLASGVIGIAGADMEAVVVEDGRELAPGRSHEVERGTTLRFAAAQSGMRSYLALPGGIDVPLVLASRSTCLTGGFGGLDGRAIAPGDELKPARAAGDATADQVWPSMEGDPLAERVVRIVPLENAPGVHRDAIAALVGQAWTVSPVGDRTGARLDGAPIPTDETAATLVSTGVLPGVIQLLPSGLPVVLLADAPTIGGYPVPAVVARADLPVVAQRQPGDDISFTVISASDARLAWAERRRELASATAIGTGDRPLRRPS